MILVINARKTQHLEAMAKTSARHWNLHAMDAARKGIGYQFVLEGMNLIQDQLELVVSRSKTLLWQNESTPPEVPEEVVDHPEAEGAWVHPGAAEMVECSR